MARRRGKPILPERFFPLRIELTGNREILVEGHGGIIEYTENSIKLGCHDRILLISGTGLKISMFSSEYILAGGDIVSVTFSQ